MVDYNFFDGYKIKKNKSSLGVRVFTLIFILLMISLVGYISMNYYILSEQQVTLIDLNEKIMAIRSTDDVERITQKQLLLDELTQIVSDLEAAGDDISHNSIIDETLLVTLSDALPSDVRISSMTISGSRIEVYGNAMSKPAIGEFEYNLRQTDMVNEIFIEAIQRSDDEDFTFSMSLSIGGDMDEY